MTPYELRDAIAEKFGVQGPHISTFDELLNKKHVVLVSIEPDAVGADATTASPDIDVVIIDGYMFDYPNEFGVESFFEKIAELEAARAAMDSAGQAEIDALIDRCREAIDELEGDATSWLGEDQRGQA